MVGRGYRTIGAVSGLREGWNDGRDAHPQGTIVGASCRASVGPLSFLLCFFGPYKSPTATSSRSGGPNFMIGGALVERLDGRW